MIIAPYLLLAAAALQGCAYTNEIPECPYSETACATQELLDIKIYQAVALPSQ
jgi:hypothetical protein